MLETISQAKKNLSQTLLKTLTYGEIVQHLDALPVRDYSVAAVERVTRLNNALGGFISKMQTILVGGINGKSLSMDFAQRVLMQESITTATVYSSCILHRTEQININGELVATKQFVDAANEVIATAQQESIEATSSELMFVIGMRLAAESGVELTLVEVGLGGQFDASAICNPVITVVTRVSDDVSGLLGKDEDEIAAELCSTARPGVCFFAADQSKMLLQRIRVMVEEKGAHWVMPIRKLAPMPYMFEQLYGRVGTIGERIAQVYVEQIKQQFSPVLRGNIVAKQEGVRGRPTFEAKRLAEIEPLRSLKDFWRSQDRVLPGHFQILDKEHPQIVLDIAHNCDAFANVFLGMRLMHYQKPLRRFTIIMAVPDNIDVNLLLSSARYLMKKIPSELLFVPVPDGPTYPLDKLLQHASKMYMRVRVFETIEAAMAFAKEITPARDGAIVLTGSAGVVREYWRLREIKKLS